MLLGFLLTLRWFLEIIYLGNADVYFLISFQPVFSLKNTSFHVACWQLALDRLYEVCVLMPTWISIYVGLSSENQELRRKAAGSMHISPLCHLGWLKQRNKTGIWWHFHLLSLISTCLGLYCSTHKERRFFFCVLRMSNPPLCSWGLFQNPLSKGTPWM